MKVGGVLTTTTNHPTSNNPTHPTRAQVERASFPDVSKALEKVVKEKGLQVWQGWDGGECARNVGVSAVNIVLV
jgi:uncharacterized protein (DUF302 family)